MELNCKYELNWYPPGCGFEGDPIDYENHRLKTMIFIEGDDLKTLKALVKKAKAKADEPASICLEIEFKADNKTILDILSAQRNDSIIILRITDMNRE